MKTHFLRAFLAGTGVYFFAGYAVFGLLLGEFSEAHTTALPGFKKEEGPEAMVWIGVSCAAYALLLCLVLLRWEKEKRVIGGLLKGAIIGLLIACMTDFYWYGTSHFYNSLLPALVDIGAAGITVGMMGAVIVWAGRERV